jgi:hypothetical protein
MIGKNSLVHGMGYGFNVLLGKLSRTTQTSSGSGHTFHNTVISCHTQPRDQNRAQTRHTSKTWRLPLLHIFNPTDTYAIFSPMNIIITCVRS